METRLQKIKFSHDSENFAEFYGYQEVGVSTGKLVHLYDENGEQLDNGNGYFPSATWECIGHSAVCCTIDDFWNAIENMRDLVE